jgi:hypothetical protein
VGDHRQEGEDRLREEGAHRMGEGDLLKGEGGLQWVEEGLR